MDESVLDTVLAVEPEFDLLRLQLATQSGGGRGGTGTDALTVAGGVDFKPLRKTYEDVRI